VLKRLSAGHSFMQKSYWLNTGDPISAADPLVAAFRTQMPDFDSNQVVQPICLPTLDYWGNVRTGNAFSRTSPITRSRTWT